MSAAEWIIIGITFALVLTVLIWAYRKRHRLFFNAHFTAETTMMNYQDAQKRQAMEYVQHMNEEKEEDESGEEIKFNY